MKTRVPSLVKPKNLSALFITELARGLTPPDKGEYLARLNMPVPHAKQRDLANSTAKRRVVCAGRRGGKTQGEGMIGIDFFLSGKVVLFVSTSQDQTDLFWSFCKKILEPLLDLPDFYKNETKRVMEFMGGRIRCKTGSNPDILRGEFADLLILDECAYLHPAAWYEVAAPMMADRDGTVIFSSTPKRKNWFFDLYNKAKMDKTGRWETFHFTTHDNPYLSEVAVQELESDMTADSYKQEILAEFLDDAGAVFRNVRECVIIDRHGNKISAINPYKGRFVAGLDLAQVKDYTALTVFDVKLRRLVDLEHFNQTSFALLREKVGLMIAKWDIETVFAESNSMGALIEDMIAVDGYPVQPFATTSKSKPAIIQALQLAFERHEIEIIDNPTLIGELSSFEGKASIGGMKYSAPEGLHDDTVMSLAIGWWGVVNGSAGIFEWDGKI